MDGIYGPHDTKKKREEVKDMKRIKEMINKGVASLWGVAGTVLFGASYAILSYTDTYLFGKDYLPEPVPIPSGTPTPRWTDADYYHTGFTIVFTWIADNFLVISITVLSIIMYLVWRRKRMGVTA